jgi:catechol 2,3-dioxygenase-like lactoylglutathione lyase family enzyme
MFAVRDVERSVAFYCDVLGFERVDYPHIPLLRHGGLELSWSSIRRRPTTGSG